MQRTEAQWQKLYSNYQKKWNELNAKLPEGMADKMYSYLNYRNAYHLIEESREKEIAKGERKVLNTQRDLINDQKFKYSQKQARAIKKALIEKTLRNTDFKQFSSDKEFKKFKRDLAKQFKVSEIRQKTADADDIYAAAKAKNEELKSQTYKEYDDNGNLVEKPLFSGKDRAKIISQVIFGSK